MFRFLRVWWLARQLRHKAPWVRCRAAGQIASLGDPRGVQPLADALEDAEEDDSSPPHVQEYTRNDLAKALAELLARCPDPEFIPALRKVALDMTFKAEVRDA